MKPIMRPLNLRHRTDADEMQRLYQFLVVIIIIYIARRITPENRNPAHLDASAQGEIT
jgi:hypothetical protein